MNLNLFIKGKYTSTVAIILYLVGVYLTSLFITDPVYEMGEGLLFPNADRWFTSTLFNHLFTALLSLGGAILLLRINDRFSLIQKRTLLPFIFFLLFQVTSPALSFLCNGNLVAVLLLLLLFIFFGAYQQGKAQPAFLIAMIISASTIFAPRFFYYIPLFIIGFFQIRYASLKSLMGCLVGIITPFWIGIGLDIIKIDQTALLRPDFSLQHLLSIPYDNPQLWTVILTLLLGFFSGISNLYTTFNEKRQIRAYNGFINLLSVYTAILLLLDYQNYTFYLPILNAAVAIQSSFLFTNNDKKAIVVLFYLVLTLDIALFTWNLLPI